MKQFLVYFGLFLFFAASTGWTKYLDGYSQNYVACADKWETSVELAQDQPVLAERLLEIEANGEMTVNGDYCPILRYDHSEDVRAKLEAIIS